MSNLQQKMEWQDLARERERLAPKSLQDFFADHPRRAQEFIYSAAGVSLDISKNPFDRQLIETLNAYAQSVELPAAIANLSNFSHHLEQRAKPDYDALKKIIHWVNQHDFDTVVHLGTGGSYLGPCLLDSALVNYSSKKFAIHFVKTLDESEIRELLKKINPKRTLFIMVSKSFSTAETLMNAQIALQYAPIEQFIAITAEPEVAIAWGVKPDNILSFDKKLGGRFSLWSAVSLSVILNIGLENYAQLLAGGAAMDAHYQRAKFSENLPVLSAYIDFWLTSFCDYHSRCVVPYSHHLRYLPDYLQQLHMESLAKSFDLQDKPIDYATGGIIWGQEATPSQHSFHQYLLQGNHRESVDFVLPLKNERDKLNEVMIANCLSQSELLTIGYHSAEIYKSIEGNKPNTLIMIDALTPFSLGALLAMYEHKVYTMSVFWQINAFDQWAVERGKFLALQPKANLNINQYWYTKILESRYEEV